MCRDCDDSTVPRTGPLPRELSPTWRYALLGGLVSIPFTVASYWQTGDEMSLSAAFFAALLTGYLAKRRGLESSPVGARTGLVGALPVVLILYDVLAFAAAGLGGPAWFRVVGFLGVGLFGVVFLALGAGISVLAGWAGGRIGGWVAERTGGRRRPSVGS